jgi:alcohol dehydrogenase (cytochrome c)
VHFVRLGQAVDAPRDVPPASPARPVSFDEIATVRAVGRDWLTYGGSYSASRYSALDAITPANVHQLGLRWIYPVPRDPGEIQASALVRDGVAYLTAPANVVLALDAATGRELWRYERPPPSNLQAGEFGIRANRGLAMLGDRVFVATLDARLVALSVATGTPVWETEVDDPRTHRITSAPLAFRDLVVVGLGSQAGGRGAIVAYGATDGRERWRFATIPPPGEVGHTTWAGDSWRVGGASAWQTGSYDPKRDLLVWGVGNPKPDYDAAARRGDNLYSNAAVALRGSSGQLVWHFQFTPGDDHDWDSAQSPLLADLPDGDRVLWANRNGFYYVLERDSGRFITGQAFARQNWAEGLSRSGRPILRKMDAAPLKGTLTYPSNGGATNWWTPAWDATRQLVFVPVLEEGMVFFRGAQSWPRPDGRPSRTGIRALAAASGKLVWEHMHAPRRYRAETGSLLATTTGVLFGSDLNTFFALDSSDGARLWSIEAGGAIEAPPVSYGIGDEQFVLTIAGSNIMAFALPVPAGP